MSRGEIINKILRTILNSGIAKSLIGKAFIINILPEIGAVLITKDYYSPLLYIYSCILLLLLAHIIEGTEKSENEEW